jgi:hypothetical protein
MTIMPKYKPCKGTGKAKGYGCKKPSYKRVYGLCDKCYVDWLLNTPEGKEKLEKTRIKARKKVEKELKPKRKYIKWADKDLKDMVAYVQDEICNPYIRLRDIENSYRCISSGGVVEHAGHYISVGENASMRFIISNIHGQSARANTHKHGDVLRYKEGLINRFGQKYLDDLERLKVKYSTGKHLDKLEVIRIGKTYEWLTKKKVWCWIHDEFENYKNIINK